METGATSILADDMPRISRALETDVAAIFDRRRALRAG